MSWIDTKSCIFMALSHMNHEPLIILLIKRQKFTPKSTIDIPAAVTSDSFILLFLVICKNFWHKTWFLFYSKDLVPRDKDTHNLNQRISNVFAVTPVLPRCYQ